MLRKTIITYYAVWYLAHKNSRYSTALNWYRAFLQVAESSFALLLTIHMLLKGIFDIYTKLAGIKMVLFFFIIPAIILYFLIFHIYRVEKNAPVQYFDYLKINKVKTVGTWFFFIFINLSMLLSMYLFLG